MSEVVEPEAREPGEEPQVRPPLPPANFDFLIYSLRLQADLNIVIDTTPDFRLQVLRARLTRLDAIVYTHAHADHILGLDDVRPFNYRQGSSIPIYASRKTFAVIERVFAYVFDNHNAKS